MTDDGDYPTKSRKVPPADDTRNFYQEEVIGNKTDAPVTTPGTTKSIMACVKGVLNILADMIVAKDPGVTQVVEVSITAAANAGVTTIATITTQPCLIKSVVIHADAAQTVDMTTCAVEGGTGQVVEFIGTADATQANLDAADKQVSWVGAVRLGTGELITIDLLGTGATAIDLTIIIEYVATVDGGYLA